MTRQELINHITKTYSANPEFPFPRDNESCVFRHGSNRRWFALVMRVPYQTLGMNRDGVTDILNLKCDPFLIGSLRGRPGFLPAYHMNKDKWLTVLLDGSADSETITNLLGLSYDLTKPKPARKKDTPHDQKAMEEIPAMRELFRMDRHDYNPEGKVYERPSARAIIMKNGKVLLNYVSKYDCYEFPGGGIEAGETPERAMQREVAEETGQVVVPESIRKFGIVIRRQRDSEDPDGIFEQKNYYYLCDVTGEAVPRKPDEHEILEGAEPVWVDSLALPIERNRKAFERIGEPFIQREMRVMGMADKELRG